MGEIRISANGEDFAPRLLHRPGLAFAWLYLLARETRKAGNRITRAALADELRELAASRPGRRRRNAEIDSHGQERSNQTQLSST